MDPNNPYNYPYPHQPGNNPYSPHNPGEPYPAHNLGEPYPAHNPGESHPPHNPSGDKVRRVYTSVMPSIWLFCCRIMGVFSSVLLSNFLCMNIS